MNNRNATLVQNAMAVSSERQAAKQRKDRINKTKMEELARKRQMVQGLKKVNNPLVLRHMSKDLAAFAKTAKPAKPQARRVERQPQSAASVRNIEVDELEDEVKPTKARKSNANVWAVIYAEDMKAKQAEEQKAKLLDHKKKEETKQYLSAQKAVKEAKQKAYRDDLQAFARQQARELAAFKVCLNDCWIITFL